jgi:hypothetical protein
MHACVMVTACRLAYRGAISRKRQTYALRAFILDGVARHFKAYLIVENPSVGLFNAHATGYIKEVLLAANTIRGRHALPPFP